VVPFFISDGLHSYEDIPVLLVKPAGSCRSVIARPAIWRNPTEKRDKRVWYSASIGSEPHLADVILERVREAAKRPAPDSNG